MGPAFIGLLSIDGLNMHDTRAFMEHIEFLSVQAMHDDFKDSAHVEYDLTIRKLAESLGFEAFSQTNAGMSIKYYGAQNMHVSKAPYTRRFEKYSKVKWTCFRWNREFGCAKSEEECGYTHACSKCYNKSHRRLDCKKE